MHKTSSRTINEIIGYGVLAIQVTFCNQSILFFSHFVGREVTFCQSWVVSNTFQWEHTKVTWPLHIWSFPTIRHFLNIILIYSALCYNHWQIRQHFTVTIPDCIYSHWWPRQNGRHFADDISKCIFLNENAWISIKISLKFIPKGQIDTFSALAQIMAWRRSGDKPLSEPMMVR